MNVKMSVIGIYVLAILLLNVEANPTQNKNSPDQSGQVYLELNDNNEENAYSEMPSTDSSDAPSDPPTEPPTEEPNTTEDDSSDSVEPTDSSTGTDETEDPNETTTLEPTTTPRPAGGGANAQVLSFAIVIVSVFLSLFKL